MQTDVQVCVGIWNRHPGSTEADRGLNIQVACDVTVGHWVMVPDVSKDHIGFRIEVKWHIFFEYLILKMQALQSFRIPCTTHPATQYNISEDMNLQ